MLQSRVSNAVCRLAARSQISFQSYVIYWNHPLFWWTMSAFTTLSTSRLGVEPNCKACGAGAVVSFNWAFAHERGAPEDTQRVAPFIHWKSLRRGSLYRCDVCHEVWHLDGAGHTMTYVSSTRLPLVLEWDREPIKLTEESESRLERIGPTPPDVYGNGRDRRMTPCKVISTAGEVIDPAMVCVQLDAPVQEHMPSRLGSDIASIEDSEFALPVDVRLASSRGEEMRMGFYPSLIEMPDGKRFVLNGTTSFMAEPGYIAADARVAEGSYFAENAPPPLLHAPIVTYFVVDGDPGWRTHRPPQRGPFRGPSWLRRLFNR